MLYIFVEGSDDEAYINRVFKHCFPNMIIIQYAKMKKEKVLSFLRSILSIPDSDYLFLSDSDGLDTSSKKEYLLEIYPDLQQEKMYIVHYEIESWYYAGLPQSESLKLKMKHYQEITDTLTKEQFDSKLSRPSDRLLIKSKILDLYSLELAITRNASLNLFYSDTKKETHAVC